MNDALPQSTTKMHYFQGVGLIILSIFSHCNKTRRIDINTVLFDVSLCLFFIHKFLIVYKSILIINQLDRMTEVMNNPSKQ